MAVLITGGAGYIGSHCALALLQKHRDVIIFDNLSTGNSYSVDVLNRYGNVLFVKGDLINKNEISSVFKNYGISEVMHFAAFSQVAESVGNPSKYYNNNITGTLNLLDAMTEAKVKKIIFSSSAAIYGEPQYLPIDENHPQMSLNPYGKTKQTAELILDDYDKAFGISSVRLRYFNAAGASEIAPLGEIHNPETHLIPNILQSTFGGGKTFEIFGTDYDTKDGTCIRDYINVEDLAQAHVLASEYLENGGKTDYFNLGTNEGNSVKEVFELCEKITGANIKVSFKPRRNGDCAVLVANNKKAQEKLNWHSKKNLEKSIRSAYEFEKLRRQNAKPD